MVQPEDQAREKIDRMLAKLGWAARDQNNADITAYGGLAIRNFSLKQGYGFADYLLYVRGKVAGVVETKKEAVILAGVKGQLDSKRN